MVLKNLSPICAAKKFGESVRLIGLFECTSLLFYFLDTKHPVWDQRSNYSHWVRWSRPSGFWVVMGTLFAKDVAGVLL